MNKKTKVLLIIGIIVELFSVFYFKIEIKVVLFVIVSCFLVFPVSFWFHKIIAKFFFESDAEEKNRRTQDILLFIYSIAFLFLSLLTIVLRDVNIGLQNLMNVGFALNLLSPWSKKYLI